MNWYLEAFRRFGDFKGRSRRKEYWYFFLFNLLASWLFLFIDYILGTYSTESMIGLVNVAYSLVALIPGLSVSVRRLHDTGRTGWWMLINFIPVIGWIVFIVFMVFDSDPAANKYGPCPKPV